MKIFFIANVCAKYRGRTASSGWKPDTFAIKLYFALVSHVHLGIPKNSQDTLTDLAHPHQDGTFEQETGFEPATFSLEG